MKKKVYWGIGIALVVVAIVFGSAQYMIGTNEPLMTEEEVKQVVNSKFAGDILSSELTHANGKETYKVLIEEDAGTYVLFVDAATGKIEQLNQEEEKGDAKQPDDDENKEPISPEEAEQMLHAKAKEQSKRLTIRKTTRHIKRLWRRKMARSLKLKLME
ncbi:PepSY domain-containing protein [Bacillus sp. JCM 19041]|uniref:PepSY domain-containing protein n=1 Tax=Bacillus sp. JCM 19041 TaxID=1460637 RepID=UPI0006CF9CE3